MADDLSYPRRDGLDVLQSMSTRLRAAERIDSQEVERALEAGFAGLIALEADLSRARARASAGSERGAAAIADLTIRIESLREALTVLRTLSAPPGEARIGYGFVMPGPQRWAHADPN